MARIWATVSGSSHLKMAITRLPKPVKSGLVGRANACKGSSMHAAAASAA